MFAAQPYLITEASESMLPEIVALSAQNLRTIVSEQERADQGFITWQYDLPLLKAMHQIAPSIVALYEGKVVGYALVATHAMASVHTQMAHMLEHWATLTYRDKPLNQYRYYMMGQICVAKEHRGQALTDRMYQFHRERYGSEYQLLLTEISTSNHRSQKAHERAGFKTIHTYPDHDDMWNVVCWDWTL